MDGSGLMVRLFFICSVFPVALSNHFLGGNIIVRPKPGGAEAEMEITSQFLVRRSANDYFCNSSTLGNSNWDVHIKCQYNCDDTVSLSLSCTEYSPEVDWSLLKAHATHSFNVSDVDKITLGTHACCWNFPYDGQKWNISTTFSVVARNDTDEINSSPHVEGFPYLRLQEGHNHTISLMISDPDDDEVRCRWAIGRECGGICDGFPGAVLDGGSCAIRYYANHGIGKKAVAIMIEDFLPESSEPLSSVAYQFFVEVVSASQLCSLLPEVISPSLTVEECIPIIPKSLFTKQIIVNSGCPDVAITSIQVFAPTGTSKGELHHVEGTNNYYINITWMPTEDQHNITHLLCFVAVNSENLTSEQSCIRVAVEYYPPTPLPKSAAPNHQLIYSSDVTLNIMFDVIIQRPAASAFVRFFKLGEEVHRIDILSPEVTYNRSRLTIASDHTFPEGSLYVNLDEGVVRTVDSIEGCHLVNERIVSETFWTFEVIHLTPKIIAVGKQMVGYPLILQCSVTTIRDTCINSRVDFVWISNGKELRRVEGGSEKLTADSLVVHADYYITSQLSTDDSNNVYICEVTVNKIRPISATGSFTLNALGGTEVTYNNCIEDDDNDDDDGNVFMISLAASVVLNLLLAVLVILVACLLIRQKKKRSYSTSYKAENVQFVGKREPMYDLPTLRSQAEQRKESLSSYGYSTQDEKVSKQHSKSDDSKVKLEKNPSYRCATYNNL